jgi:hypothetical protein
MLNSNGGLKKRRPSTESKNITQAPALLSPYFDQEFILYTFSSDITFAVVLTQKNLEGDEFPCGFYEFRSTRS